MTSLFAWLKAFFLSLFGSGATTQSDHLPVTVSPTPSAPVASPSPVATPVAPVAPMPAQPSQYAGVIPVPSDPSARVRGLDIYHGDNVTSWGLLFSSGRKYVCAKATQGTNMKDLMYPANRRNAKLAGLIFGAYHFIDSGISGADQADYFISYLQANGGVAPEDFLMLDWESTSSDVGLVKDFLDRVKVKIGRRCVLYCGYPMVDGAGNPSWLAEYPLWLAEYGPKAKPPLPWKTYNFWQDSGDATIQGLGNTGDDDLFQGNLDDLKALIAYTVLP